jgi:hypothetical protein
MINMKKVVFVWASILFLFCSFSYAQTAKDVFSPQTEITWLGLDFTAAKFQGDRERLGTESDLRKLITTWNNLMMNEPEKFDVGKSLDRSLLKNAIPMTIQHNEGLNLSQPDDGKATHMTKEDISHIVSSYKFKSLSGVGLLFVVESFNKIEEKAFIWVTFINLNTKEVLFTERLAGAPSGFGIRNYWGGGVYSVIKQIKSKYGSWKKKYGAK